MLAASDLETLAAILRGTDVLLLSDEVYEHIVFDGREHQSVLRHDELYARSFAVSSFGKSYHATGWKIGWAAAPPALTNELRKVHQFVTFSITTAEQHALADVLGENPQHLNELGAFYQAKPRSLSRAARRRAPFRLLPVAGAYFQLADYTALSDEDDVTFSAPPHDRIRRNSDPLSPFAPPRAAARGSLLLLQAREGARRRSDAPPASRALSRAHGSPLGAAGAAGAAGAPSSASARSRNATARRGG